MLIKESETDEAKMSFGINEISMSWFGVALAWSSLAWLGPAVQCSPIRLAWLDSTWHCLPKQMVWPESGMCQIADCIGHRRPRFSFVAVCFARPLNHSAWYLFVRWLACLLVFFSLSHSHFAVKSFYGLKLTQFHDSHHNLCWVITETVKVNENDCQDGLI